MKTAVLTTLLVAGFAARANLIYMPLSFTLSTAKETYLEGEKVEFLLTITNEDSVKAHPVLLPHTQNTGNKLIYFDVYDHYQKAFLKRAGEDRTINMRMGDRGSLKKIMLQPREKIVIPFYWNDFENNNAFHTQIASHHWLHRPLFVGEYWIMAYYNPKGTPMGDTLYHYYATTNDKKSATKLNFLEGGITATCMLKIRKAPPGKISIQGTTYLCKDLYENDPYNKNQSFHYYQEGDTLTDVHFVETGVNEYKIKGRDYHYNKATGIADSISRYKDGSIEKYWKYRGECPTDLEKREYNEAGQLTFQSNRWPDGSVKRQKYFDDGRLQTEELFSPDGKKLTITEYIYNQDHSLKRTTTTVRRDPCLVKLLELKETDE